MLGLAILELFVQLSTLLILSRFLPALGFYEGRVPVPGRVQVLGSHRAQVVFHRYGNFVDLTPYGEYIIAQFPRFICHCTLAIPTMVISVKTLTKSVAVARLDHQHRTTAGQGTRKYGLPAEFIDVEQKSLQELMASKRMPYTTLDGNHHNHEW